MRLRRYVVTLMGDFSPMTTKYFWTRSGALKFCSKHQDEYPYIYHYEDGKWFLASESLQQYHSCRGAGR